MAQLRAPEGGCPWDAQQDFRTISPYTVEEAYEVADAIARGDVRDLADVLGDLLFQVVFHAQIASEQKLFDFGDVVAGIVGKMLRRHPHVFADAEAGSAEDQRRSWESIKARERKEDRRASTSALDGVPLGMPATIRARMLQKRAAGVGFDWRDVRKVLDKLREEVEELDTELAASETAANRDRLREELGDVLFTAVNVARHLELDPETALVEANARFERRFKAMETEVRAGRAPARTMSQLDVEALESLWQQVKQRAGRQLDR